MKLSENQELVQKLKQILADHPGLEYEERGSAHIDDGLIVRVSSDVKCDLGTAGYVAKKLGDSTGDHYKAQLYTSSDKSTPDHLRSFKVLLQEPNRNVRITYPDDKHGTLEVDIVQGMEVSLNLDNPQLWYFAEGNKLTIRLNTFARPNYRGYLNSRILPLVRNSNESPDSCDPSNSRFEDVIGDNTDSRD